MRLFLLSTPDDPRYFSVRIIFQGKFVLPPQVIFKNRPYARLTPRGPKSALREVAPRRSKMSVCLSAKWEVYNLKLSRLVRWELECLQISRSVLRRARGICDTRELYKVFEGPWFPLHILKDSYFFNVFLYVCLELYVLYPSALFLSNFLSLLSVSKKRICSHCRMHFRP